MSKTIAIVLIVFWISFGFISSYLNSNTSISYQTLMNNFKESDNSITGYLTLFTGMIAYFFMCMTLTISGIPTALTLFVLLMQVMSILYIVWTIIETVPNFLPF